MAAKIPVSEIVQMQIDAMAAPMFEVGLLLMGGTDNKGSMMLRTWDPVTLSKSLGWLKHQNAQGRNIYIRPHGEHALSLLDDLSEPAIAAMKSQGYTPSVVVETSPGNFQAWLNHGMVLPADASTMAARALATKFGGDPSSADWRHFGRLAGLTNRKEKHRREDGLYPFVRLVEAHAHVYPKAGPFLTELQERIRTSTQSKAAIMPVKAIRSSIKSRYSIDDFRGRPEYGGDQNRIDLAYATYALAHGVGEQEVRTAIGSRDLTKKGNEARQADYIDRTVRKALVTVDQYKKG